MVLFRALVKLPWRMNVVILSDSFGRQFPYLRLSVTDQCNFKCVYCLPDGYQGGSHPSQFLSLTEIYHLIMAFSELGLKKVRITGGEPTLRRDLLGIISMIRNFENVEVLALSTNGHNLKNQALRFKQAGLTHLNISLDDLDQGRFFKIRGRDCGQEVLDGMEVALECGFQRIKLNSVLMKEDWEDRAENFEKWIQDKPLTVRFIELMPTEGRREFHIANHLPAQIFKDWLLKHGWKPKNRTRLGGPACEYAHDEHKGEFGLISAYENEFCGSCNRLRVTAKGELRMCLFGKGNTNIRHLLESESQKLELKNKLIQLLKLKENSHGLHAQDPGNNRSFSAMGG